MFFDDFGPPDWLSLLSSGGTLILAGVALYQSRQSAKQIKVGRRQADTAEKQARIAEEQAESSRESVEAALQVQRESVRARVDQHAPHVVIYFEEPDPPYADSARSGMPQRDGLRLLDPKSFDQSWHAAGHEFVLPRDGRTFLWFSGRGTLVNEGVASARVRLFGESRFLGNLDPRSKDLPPEVVLSPGSSVRFRWAAGKTVDKWANGYRNQGQPIPDESIWLWGDVFDSREFGVVDTLTARFKPDVIRPVEGCDGHWRVNDAGTYGRVYPQRTKRGYVHEGAAHADLSDMHRYFGTA